MYDYDTHILKARQIGSEIVVIYETQLAKEIAFKPSSFLLINVVHLHESNPMQNLAIMQNSGYI